MVGLLIYFKLQIPNKTHSLWEGAKAQSDKKKIKLHTFLQDNSMLFIGLLYVDVLWDICTLGENLLLWLAQLKVEQSS